MYHPNCLPKVERIFEKYLENGTIVNAELVLKRKDGTKIPVLLNVETIKDENGNIYSNSCWRDIIALKQAEQKLKEFKYFFDDNKDLCAIVNTEGYF